MVQFYHMALGYQYYRRKLLLLKVALFILLSACVLLAWSVYTRWLVEREMAARRAAVEAEYQALVERHQTLQRDVEYLADERSLEAEVRKHFDVAKEGESVVVITGDDRSVPPSPRATSTEERIPWWQFWRL